MGLSLTSPGPSSPQQLFAACSLVDHVGEGRVLVCSSGWKTGSVSGTGHARGEAQAGALQQLVPPSFERGGEGGSVFRVSQHASTQAICGAGAVRLRGVRSLPAYAAAHRFFSSNQPALNGNGRAVHQATNSRCSAKQAAQTRAASPLCLGVEASVRCVTKRSGSGRFHSSEQHTVAAARSFSAPLTPCRGRLYRLHYLGQTGSVGSSQSSSTQAASIARQRRQYIA